MTRLSTVLLLLVSSLVAGCSLPWNRGVVRETNISFQLRMNQMFVPSATIGEKSGSYLFDLASAQTTVDNRSEVLGQTHVVLGALRERITPSREDLKGMAEAMIGRDVWKESAVTIDYRRGLLTFSPSRKKEDDRSNTHYSKDPSVEVRVGHRAFTAVLDTTLPDTLILPGDGPRRRTNEDVSIAGHQMGTIDVAYHPVREARVGNRLLSRFLITVDQRSKVVTLWPYESVKPN